MAEPKGNLDRRIAEEEDRGAKAAPAPDKSGQQADEVADTVTITPSAADRGALGTKVAEGAAEVKDEAEGAKDKADAYETIGADLPDNQWKRSYIELYKQLKENPQLDGPISRFMLAILATVSKYMKYTDYIPGKFLGRLNSDTSLQLEELNEREKRKFDQSRKESEEKEAARKAEVEKRLQEAAEAEKANGKLLGFEAASTEYVAWSLWGIDSIDSATVLGAKLLHTKEDSVPFYAGELKVDGDFKEGTVVILADTSDIEKGEKITAKATGKGRELEFFSPKTAKVETIDLGQKGSKAFGGLKPLAYFVPISDEKRDELKAQAEAGEVAEVKKPEVPSYGTGNAELDKARDTAEKVHEAFSAGANLFAAKLDVASKTGQIRDPSQLLPFQQESLTWESKFLEIQASLDNWKKFVEGELKNKAATLSSEQKTELETDLELIDKLKESAKVIIEIIRKRKEDLQKESPQDIK